MRASDFALSITPRDTPSIIARPIPLQSGAFIADTTLATTVCTLASSAASASCTTLCIAAQIWLNACCSSVHRCTQNARSSSSHAPSIRRTSAVASFTNTDIRVHSSTSVLYTCVHCSVHSAHSSPSVAAINSYTVRNAASIVGQINCSHTSRTKSKISVHTSLQIARIARSSSPISASIYVSTAVIIAEIRFHTSSANVRTAVHCSCQNARMPASHTSNVARTVSHKPARNVWIAVHIVSKNVRMLVIQVPSVVQIVSQIADHRAFISTCEVPNQPRIQSLNARIAS